MFWGVQIGATDRPTEMDCWSNDSNALTEEVFSRKTFVAIWCAFPYVMMRVRKPPLPVYVCAMPQPQKLVYYPRWMRRKTTRVALRIVILILSSINSLIFFAIILLCYQCRSNIIKGQMSLILWVWQAIIMLPSTLEYAITVPMKRSHSIHMSSIQIDAKCLKIDSTTSHCHSLHAKWNGALIMSFSRCCTVIKYFKESNQGPKCH